MILLIIYNNRINTHKPSIKLISGDGCFTAYNNNRI
jgi:hypothetical protein